MFLSFNETVKLWVRTLRRKQENTLYVEYTSNHKTLSYLSCKYNIGVHVTHMKISFGFPLMLKIHLFFINIKPIII